MGGSHLVLVIMDVGGGHVKFLHCEEPFEKSVFLPPHRLNGTALKIPVFFNITIDIIHF